jgi:hypothetical protein
MKQDIICSYCQYANTVDNLNSVIHCENCKQPLETISRRSFRAERKEKYSLLQEIKVSFDEWNPAVKVAVLSVLGWFLYQFRLFILLFLLEIFTKSIELFVLIGVLDLQTQYSILSNLYYFTQDVETTNLIAKYGVIFSIIGFVDKFFPEFFPKVFQYFEKFIQMIPTFPFSGLIKLTAIFIGLLFKIIWIFSSSVIRFITSLFSFIFVVVYKFSVPLFKFTMGFLDYLNDLLDKASNKLDDTSKKLEK